MIRLNRAEQRIFNAAEPYVWAAFFLFSANCGRKKQIVKF